jgi:GT2 family glycosyltransferase
MEIGAWFNTHPTGLLLPTYRCDFFCIAIRRDVWHQLNGLEQIFGLGYFEDFDFSLRLRDAGFEQVITEDVFIYHQGSATFSQSPIVKQLIKKNKQLMKERHHNINFHHVRVCNLKIIIYAIFKVKSMHPNLEKRIEIRRASLYRDLPKNPIKRAIWFLKVYLALKIHF